MYPAFLFLPSIYTKQKKDTSPVFECSCSVIKKNLEMSNDLNIFGRTIMCPIKQTLTQMKALCIRNQLNANSKCMNRPVEFMCIFLNLSV